MVAMATLHYYPVGKTQWAKSLKKQSVGVFFCDFAHWVRANTFYIIYVTFFNSVLL